MMIESLWAKQPCQVMVAREGKTRQPGRSSLLKKGDTSVNNVAF